MEFSELVKRAQSFADEATRAMTRKDTHSAYNALNELDDLLTNELPDMPPAE